MPITKKRGALSTEEMEFIRKAKDGMTVEEMAEKINRNVEPILRFLKEKVVAPHVGMTEDESDTTRLRSKLHSREYWPQIVKQFANIDNNEELEYFENTWISLMKQFKEDVLYTEEVELKQWITLDILSNRLMTDRNKQLLEIQDWQKKMAAEQKKGDDKSVDTMLLCVEQINFLKQEIRDALEARAKINAQLKDLRRDFKMARSDRIKKIEDGKISWIGLLRQLEDEDIREREGLEAEVIAIAAKKTEKKYMQPHLYQNSEWDSPILNAETIEMLDSSRSLAELAELEEENLGNNTLEKGEEDGEAEAEE